MKNTTDTNFESGDRMLIEGEWLYESSIPSMGWVHIKDYLERSLIPLSALHHSPKLKSSEHPCLATHEETQHICKWADSHKGNHECYCLTQWPSGQTRLNEIRARLSAATPGPWHRTDSLVGKVWTPDFEEELSRFTFEFDATFIANAPSDIEWLLGEVERLVRR